MKKIIEGIPFILIIGLTPFLFINTPNIAQSIIVTAVAGLAGYRYHLMNKEQPNYVKIFESKFDELRKENKDLRDKYGKMTLENNPKRSTDKSIIW